jgi:hypothetical protein
LISEQRENSLNGQQFEQTPRLTKLTQRFGEGRFEFSVRQSFAFPNYFDSAESRFALIYFNSVFRKLVIARSPKLDWLP